MKQTFDDDDDVGLHHLDDDTFENREVEVSSELEEGFDVSEPNLDDIPEPIGDEASEDLFDPLDTFDLQDDVFDDIIPSDVIDETL